MTLFWAFLAGVLTLINPCVLPLLPVILAAAIQSSRLGPLALAAGLTLSFTVLGVTITAFGHLIGLHEELMNRIAAVLMMLFGIVLLVPQAQGVLATATAPLANRANDRIDAVEGGGLAGQFFVGLLLGAVWSPCIGPTLGGAIGLAATGDGLLQATITMLFFGLGVSVIILALAYGSREMIASRRGRLMRWMPYAKPIMGVTLLIVGIILFFHLHRPIEAWLLDVMPTWLSDFSVRF